MVTAGRDPCVCGPRRRPWAGSWTSSACPGPSSRWGSNRRRPRVRPGSNTWSSASRPVPVSVRPPLAKTASGGELSRTMLACRSVLADLDAIAHAGVRRGRCRDRRSGRAGRGATAGAAGARPAGARRHPPAADRVLRRPAPQRGQARRCRHRRGAGRRRSGSPNSRACSPAWPRARAPCPTREELLDEAIRVKSVV